jgi:hypothetical protein
MPEYEIYILNGDTVTYLFKVRYQSVYRPIGPASCDLAYVTGFTPLTAEQKP